MARKRQHPCLICGKEDGEKPMAFRGTDWCCDDHRKELEAGIAGEEAAHHSRTRVTRRVCDPVKGSGVQYYDADEDSWYWQDTDVRVD
jgi:hypothetical protein